MRVKKVLLGAGVIALVLLVLVLSPQGMAAVRRRASVAGFIPTDPDFPIWDATGINARDEMHPDVALYRDWDPISELWFAEYLVVFDWWDETEGGHDIVAITVTAEGQAALSPFCVSCGDDDDMRPVVAHQPYTEYYLVVWERGPEGSKDIYGKRIRHDGSLGEEFLIAGYLGDQIYPDVAHNYGTTFNLVVWEDHDPTTPEEPPDIIGRCWSLDYGLVGATLAIAEAPRGQYRPSVGTDGRYGHIHHWLVAWREESGAKSDIYGREVSASSNPASCSFPSSAFLISDQFGWAGSPAVGWGKPDPWEQEFLVVWPEGLEMLAQRLDDEDMSLLGDPITVSDYVSAKFNPAVVSADEREEWWVVWEDTRDFGMYSLIYGQGVLFDGTVRGGSANQRVSKDPDWLPPSANQQGPAIAYNWTADNALVAWQDYGHYSNWGIWGRIWAPVERVWLPLILKSWP